MPDYVLIPMEKLSAINIPAMWLIQDVLRFVENPVKGEKCGFQKTEILKKHKFPEINDEKFLPEAIVWNRIAQNIKQGL